MNNSTPLVSILMNSYNSEKHLVEALESVKNQKYSNFEVVFIDNHSTDKSKDIAQGFGSRLKYFETPEFCCLGKARNFGIKKCMGKYITFLDTDDVWHPEKLTHQIALMNTEDPVLVYSPVNYIDDNSDYLSTSKVTKKPSFSSLIKRYDINMQTAMINCDILDRNDIVFDEKLSYNPDYNLFMTIAFSHKIISTPKVLANYRIATNSLSEQLKDIQLKENIKVLNRLSAFKGISINDSHLVANQKKYYLLKSRLSKILKISNLPNLSSCLLMLSCYNAKFITLLCISLLPGFIKRPFFMKLLQKGIIR